MMFPVLLAAAIASSSISSCRTAPKQAETTTVIRALENAWNQAHIDGDTAFLACMLDPRFMGVDAKGNLFYRAQEFAGAIATAQLHRHYDATTAPVPTISIHDRIAISTGVVPKAGTHGKHGSRWTDIYRYDGMHWHAIYSGASAF